ncbi:hypothetical protein ACOI7N_26325, partial [Pseudomonas sp. P2758]|uniref:hypothetical protein n=1 Tax=Pseudomonas sp. P2758 TaxID=3409916 RepID=UPI003B5C579A
SAWHGSFLLLDNDTALLLVPDCCRRRGTVIDPKLPLVEGSCRPRVCKNVFKRDRYSKLAWKWRIYTKSTSADVPINFRFNVDAHTSTLAKSFYTLWARNGRSMDEYVIINETKKYFVSIL